MGSVKDQSDGIKSKWRLAFLASLVALLCFTITVVYNYLKIFQVQTGGGGGNERLASASASPTLRADTKGSGGEGEDEALEPYGIPIYLVDASSQSSGAVTSSLDYRFLASVWDRETTFKDIFMNATNNHTSHANGDESLERKLKSNNVTTILHTSPKMASSTLRQACMDTQQTTCPNLPPDPRRGSGNKQPQGYLMPKRLTELFELCPDTRHFCVKGGLPVIKNYTRFYDTRTFVHMFAFRKYEDWAISALHQISYRDGEEGCVEAEELLDDCLPHRYELDFEKYSKYSLGYFVNRFRQQTRRSSVDNHHHIILLYNYQYLDATLKQLNEAFDIPLLPGTESKVNSEKPKESCKEEKRMIQKFHDCFSEELISLV